MKVLVLNGSPKAENSITLQTVLYLQQRFTDCEFEILPVARKIKAYEKDMSAPLAAIERADLLLFSYPVYTFMAPSQLHRFIELIKASGVSFAGKYATQFSTSKHFYDYTAHNYVKENCFDLGLKYIRGLSADMNDLLTEKGQKSAEDFWRFVSFAVQNDLFEDAPAAPTLPAPYTACLAETEKSDDYDTVLLTDAAPEDESLRQMIKDFISVYPYKVRVINLREFPFKGGCLGCLRCVISGKCVYTDGFEDYLRNEILTAKATVYAFTIKDHSDGVVFKTYSDRQFCNGHRTVSMGKPVGYVISGAYSAEHNVRLVVEGRAEVGHNYLCGVATDEANTAEQIKSLSATMSYALQHGYVLPQNFLGVGGMKIFRDMIYEMRGMMKADHKFFKQNGFYDFPQKNKGNIIKMKLVGALMAMPNAEKVLDSKRMNEGMMMPYKKILNKK